MLDMSPWKINKDRIMELAERKGVFYVPKYLWRAEPLAKKCRELKKEGKLRRDRTKKDRRTLAYTPVEKLE